MLMLLFRVGEERWAIAAADIHDVIPLVDLQTMPYSHSLAAGLLNYHGDMLTAVDISQLIGNCPVPQTLSTRIVVVNVAATLNADGIERRLALMVDGADEMARLSQVSSSAAQSIYAENLLQMTSGEGVQQLAIAPVFHQLFPQPYSSRQFEPLEPSNRPLNVQLNGVS